MVWRCDEDYVVNFFVEQLAGYWCYSSDSVRLLRGFAGRAPVVGSAPFFTVGDHGDAPSHLHFRLADGALALVLRDVFLEARSAVEHVALLARRVDDGLQIGIVGELFFAEDTLGHGLCGAAVSRQFVLWFVCGGAADSLGAGPASACGRTGSKGLS